MEYNKLVDRGIGHIVNHMWHKIVTADEGIKRETFLRDICAKTPIIPNYGLDQCSGIYIKNSGLPDPDNKEIHQGAVNIIFRDYYRLLIVREILNQIITDVKDEKVLKELLEYMKPELFFGGNSLQDLLNEVDVSSEIVKESYLELMRTGTLEKHYLDKVSINTCIFFHMTSTIDNLHKHLGNSYSNFALIFDTDKSLGLTSKKAINDHIFARTTGYKIYVVCEREIKTFPDPINSNEQRNIVISKWPAHTLSGEIIQEPHDYGTHDYTDDLNEAWKTKVLK